MRQLVPGALMVSLVLLLSTTALWAQAPVGEGAEPQVNEYFVRQDDDQALFIRIDSFEALSGTKIQDIDGNVLMSSQVVASRIGPMFMFIDASPVSRQLNIVVSSTVYTNRSVNNMQVNRLAVRDERSNRLAQAYQYLSFGLEVLEEESGPNWTVKISSLMRAGRAFASFGMQELQLWCQFHAANLVQNKLGDSNQALDMVNQSLAELRSSRYLDIRLALLQLRADVLSSQRKAGVLRATAEPVDPVQAAWSGVSEAAAAVGFQYERAHAEYRRGVDFAGRSVYSGALSQFEQALDNADAIEASDLATIIRENMVTIHDEQGDLTASSEVLQQIEQQLSEDNSGDELAQNRLQQGLLLISTFRYPEAIDQLSQALQAERNSMTRAQIGLALGRAYYGAGRLDEALANLRQATTSGVSGNFRRPNPLLDIGEGIRIIANIHRQRREFQPMREARSAAPAYLETDSARALHHYESGRDALATGSSQAANVAFQRSAAAGKAAGQLRWSQLATLQACAQGGAPCNETLARQALAKLGLSGLPVTYLEAQWLWSAHLSRRGNAGAAFNALDELVNGLHFYRRALPGVLGPWFAEFHEAILENYLDQASSRDEIASLLALSKIRFAAHQVPANDDFPGLAADTRVLISRRIDTGAGALAQSLASRVNATINSARKTFDADYDFLSMQGVETYLASLGPDETLLAFDLSANSARVWIAGSTGVSRLDLPRPTAIQDQLQLLHSRISVLEGAAFDAAMDEMGRLLLKPVADRLTTTLYWLPSGGLLGLPFDAMRLDGEFLAQSHRVAAVMTFPARPGPSRWLQQRPYTQVFLAGQPVDFSHEYLAGLSNSAELRAVTNQFVGPGLTLVQGNALLPDEFQNEQLSQAQLVHLAMPGVIDLASPGRSYLELSEPARGQGRLKVRASSLRDHAPQRQLSASLVYMSANVLRGKVSGRFSSRLGLVDEMLDSGAGSVISSVWPLSDEAGSWLAAGIYARLATDPDLLAAYSQTRRQFQRDWSDPAARDWAALQLFIP